MGLLDSSDEEVKNNPTYKNVLTAIEGMESAMETYKEGGGGDRQCSALAMKVERVLKYIVAGKEQFPSFGEWDTLAKDAKELAKALQEKHPDDGYVKNLGQYL